MQDSRWLKTSVGMTIFSMLMIALVLTTATYAWFTFSASTNVEPLSSTISKGDSELLISNRSTGGFGTTTEMILNREIGEMKPLSTADLEHFYIATAQNEEGISVFYKEETDPEASLMHGFVYLESIYGANDVYLYEKRLKLGGTSQINGALRLALKITTKEGISQHILKLDSLVEGDITAHQTTLVGASVVDGVLEDGRGRLIADPAVDIGDYFVKDTAEEYGAGKNKLCYIEQDEVAVVEYWLYLEGCDENCINSVQASDVDLALAFAGVTANK